MSDTEVYIAMVGNQRSVVYLDIFRQIYNEEYVREQEEMKKQNKLKNEEFIKYKIVTQGFHYSAINKLDVCLQRPLVASASQGDCNVRLWNYTTGSCELARVFYTNKRDEEYEPTDTGEKI